ncbi:MAG: hypothetical protein NWR30_10500 [Salibacteraceae bacterium]|jgi:hypothetical protein|nr:hypothetical protein [Salibacteraceae bacterium]MDP4763271.1 hypothetical protein [Salibacteraceae bacterium]MDP4935135.1 hypothetical protein [Salibacteraceae bacterium]
MTRITIDVDDDRAQELINYLNSLAYAKVTEDDVPEWHKEELDEIAKMVEDGQMPTYDLDQSLKRIFDKK